MPVERHLILQEIILRPSGEWASGGRGWTLARVAEGNGYWLQGGNAAARALNPGDGLVLAVSGGGRLRVSQLGPLKLQYFTVHLQALNGLLTVAEWHQLENLPSGSAAQVLHFNASEPVGQKFTQLASQTPRDGLPASVRARWAAVKIGKLAGPRWQPSSQMWKIDSLQISGPIRELMTEDATNADVIIIATSSLTQGAPALIQWLNSLKSGQNPRPVGGLLIGLFGDEETTRVDLEGMVKPLLRYAQQTGRDFIWHRMGEGVMSDGDWLTESLENLLARKSALNHETVFLGSNCL